nr:NBS/LRR disease resistance protein, putative [Arabidopsis thaliana]AAM91258.1 NBS/LRR disease resistance protein, putative [Arabidopsis thaliana]
MIKPWYVSLISYVGTSTETLLEWRRGLLSLLLVKKKCSKRHGIALWKIESESWVFTVWVVLEKPPFSRKSTISSLKCLVGLTL